MECQDQYCMYSPIFTIRIDSSSSKNLSATETFSSFCDLKVGRLLCFGSLLPDSTSIRVIRRKPSHKSVSKLPMCLLTVFKCSFAQRVNVFCWIRFHCASSASSRSVATISSCSSVLQVSVPASLLLFILYGW